MATGFKVADAYVLVHTEDATKMGRDKIGRDTDAWSRKMGDKAGRNIAGGILKSLTAGLTAMMAAMLKFGLISALIGFIGTAVTALGGYIVQLMGSVTVLAQALWTSLGVLVLIPGAIFTLIGAITTLKLGFSGLGTALKAGLSGDLAAFEESLSKLAPAAQDFAREVVALKPAWDALKLSIQETLFQGIAPLFRELAEVYIPLLERGLGKVSGGLNAVFRAIGRSLLDPYTSRNVEATLGSIGRILENLAVGLEPLLTALSQVVSVSAGILADMSERWGAIMTSWADALMAIPEDQWQVWVDNGIAALKLIGGAFSDLFAIIGGIFKAAGPSDLFGWLDRVREWVQSFHGQETLVTFFQALRTAAEALSPALFELFRVLANLMEIMSETMVVIGPTLELLIHTLGDVLGPLLGGPMADLLNALGKVLVGLLEGLGPGAAVALQAIADAFAALVPVAKPVGRALGELLEAVAPLVKVLLGSGLAVLLLSMAEALELLALAAAPVIELFAELIDALANDFLRTMQTSGAFDEIAKALRDFGDAVRPLIPPLVQFGRQVMQKLLDVVLEMQPIFTQVFLQVLMRIIQQLPSLVQRLAPLMPMLIDLAAAFGEALLTALERLAPEIPTLVDLAIDLAVAFQDLAVQLIPVLPLLAELAILTLTHLLPALIPMIPAFFQLVVAFTDLLKAMTTKGPGGYSLLDAMVFMVGALITFNSQHGPLYLLLMMAADGLKKFAQIVSIVGRSFSGLIQGLVDIFTKVPGIIFGALSKLPGVLWNVGRAILDGLIRGIASKIGELKQLLSFITFIIPAWKGPLDVDRRLLVPSGQATMDGYIKGIQSRIPQLHSVLTQLTGSISGMAGAANLAAGAAGAAAMGAQELNVAVYVGERPVRDMVHAEIVQSPELISAGAREGDRRRTFVDPAGRRRG